MNDKAMTRQQQQPPNGGGNTLRRYLEQPEAQAKLREVAYSGMRAEDLTRLALMASSRDPKLARCTPTSVLRSLMDAAALGIKPGGLLGRGYLVPRVRTWKDESGRKHSELECTFDPGWRGLADIARRSGAVRRIEAHVVYEADEFSVTRSPFTSIHHVPFEGDQTGAIRAAYAVAEFSNGSTQIEIVWRRDLDHIRKLGAEYGPWSTWPDEMARKSAVRRLCKYLPFDPQLERALEAATESEMDAPMARDVESLPAAPARTPREPQTARLAQRLSSRRAADASGSPAVAVAYDEETGEVEEAGTGPASDESDAVEP